MADMWSWLPVLRSLAQHTLRAEQRARLSRLACRLEFMPRAEAVSFPFRDYGRPHRACLVTSAGLELGWAWRYAKSGAPDPLRPATRKASQARHNMPRLLDLFDRYRVAVTWATVGHLFLERCTREHGLAHPALPRPACFEVDGASRMDDVASAARRRASRWRSFRRVPWPLIPVDHAFDLYRRGSARSGWGAMIMGSLYTIGLSLGLPGRFGRQQRRRSRLKRIIEALDWGSVAQFAAGAPWYAGCILPFLAAVAANVPHEFILTWNHAGQLPALPLATAESSVVITGKEIRAAGQTRHLPQVEADWLRQVRRSERLLIRAVVERSPDLAVEAWAAHPGVGSLAQAERLALSYFRV